MDAISSVRPCCLLQGVRGCVLGWTRHRLEGGLRSRRAEGGGVGAADRRRSLPAGVGEGGEEERGACFSGARWLAGISRIPGVGGINSGAVFVSPRRGAKVQENGGFVISRGSAAAQRCATSQRPPQPHPSPLAFHAATTETQQVGPQPQPHIHPVQRRNHAANRYTSAMSSLGPFVGSQCTPSVLARSCEPHGMLMGGRNSNDPDVGWPDTEGPAAGPRPDDELDPIGHRRAHLCVARQRRAQPGGGARPVPDPR